MKTNQEQNIFFYQSGNALVYVLIAIALFAALGFTLSRQNDGSGANQLSDQEATLYATQLISYSAQAKSAIDQMFFTGSEIDDLDFTLPNEAGFNAPPHMHKVFHPLGGGLNPGNLPQKAQTEIATTPPANWYLGRFNNIEWTATTAHEVILTAYQIKQEVCAKINKHLTGNTTIPALNGSMSRYLIDTVSNSGMTTVSGSPVCTACHQVTSMCVSNAGETAFSFYTIIADR